MIFQSKIQHPLRINEKKKTDRNYLPETYLNRHHVRIVQQQFDFSIMYMKLNEDQIESISKQKGKKKV